MGVRKLTLKQQAFADYYIETANAEESARRAGYSEATARGHAHKMLQNVAIKKYIDERIAEKEKERIASQDEVLEYYTAVMRGELTEPVLVLDGDGTQRIEYLPPNFTARNKAAEQLGKRYALWTDKQDVNVQGAVTFVDDISGDDE